MLIKNFLFDEYASELKNLRKLCWSQNGLSAIQPIISDSLDEKPFTRHWGVFFQEKLVAASRVSILHSELDFEFEYLLNDVNKDNKTYAFYSRLVVHPDFQNKGISRKLDKVRLNFLEGQKLDFIFATAKKNRFESLKELGWRSIGSINNHKNSKWVLGKSEIIIYEYPKGR